MKKEEHAARVKAALDRFAGRPRPGYSKHFLRRTTPKRAFKKLAEDVLLPLPPEPAPKADDLKASDLIRALLKPR